MYLFLYKLDVMILLALKNKNDFFNKLLAKLCLDKNK